MEAVDTYDGVWGEDAVDFAGEEGHCGSKGCTVFEYTLS